MKVIVKNLSKSYGDKKIFDKFNLELSDDKVNCIIGESGCGKSTFLNILCGLEDIEQGDIDGVCLKDISYVFQEDRLLEYLTVEENLELMLKRYYNKDELASEISRLLKMLGIEHVKNEYPGALSGGMKQRVNIARAFGKPSNVILMDEPFKSLDYKLKYSIIDEFKEILKDNKRMVIMVTHDVDEAIYFDGNIFVFGGRPVKVKAMFNKDLAERKDEILEII